MDTGTHESLVEATNCKTIEIPSAPQDCVPSRRSVTGTAVGKDQLLDRHEPLKKNQYGQYLMTMNGKYIDKQKPNSVEKTAPEEIRGSF